MYPNSFQKLIDQFHKLPSIGPKMAERLVLYIFKQDETFIDEFIQRLNDLKKISLCEKCFNISEDALCVICSDTHRDHTKICIVEEPLDIIPIERSHIYNGLYHVLGGTISQRKKSHNLTLHQLYKKIQNDTITEIIIATNFTTEGDMTAMHIIRQLSTYQNITITRLARGLATGSDIEYADDITIRSALANREQITPK